MGMPITLEIVGSENEEILNKVFDYFVQIDNKFSTYKSTSEITLINKGELELDEYTPEMKEILFLAKQTKFETKGYFNIEQEEKIDPSGIVKGWAILKAAEILRKENLKNFYIDAGGDIEAAGLNSEKKPWRVGIRNPFNAKEIVKVLKVSNKGVATSGTYERGKHIYNPKTHSFTTDIVSLTIVGPNVYEADRFATGAFAMGKEGIDFIEKQKGFEGYIIDKNGKATYTSGFEKYVAL